MARVEVSIAFDSGARLGPVDAKLLGAIRETGSISAAARHVGVPYKRAWMLLDSMNRAFKEPLIEAATGGKGGGGAMLTHFGADILGQYQRMLAAAETALADDLAVFSGAVIPAQARQVPGDGRNRGNRKPR
jgi:molybdate transport system regulatory protein